MKIEKIPEGYLLARKGGNGCELWRKFNGAESMACDAIDELIAERDALRAKIEQMERQEPYSYIYEYANPIDGSPVWRDTPGYWNAQYPRSSKPLYARPGAQPAPSTKDAIIDDLQSQFDSDGITEHNSGDALIRLSDAIAAVEDNFAQPAPSFADAYQGAMEEVAIWKKRALEAEELNRKFIAEINGPTYMGEPAQSAPSLASGDVSLISEGKTQPAPSVPDVDALAQFIREVDGKHQLGAGALAERIVEWLAAAPEAKP